MQFYYLKNASVWISAEGYIIRPGGNNFSLRDPLGNILTDHASPEEAEQAAILHWVNFIGARMEGVPEFEEYPDPQKEGARAYAQQVPRHECPHPDGPQRVLWMHGWISMYKAVPQQHRLAGPH